MRKVWLIAAFLLCSLVGVNAQSLVVQTCGTLPLAYAPGATRNDTVDVNGNKCTNISISTPIAVTGAFWQALQPISGSYFYNVAGSTLTRASNTTQYAANETVCLAASVTACAPGTIAIATVNQGKGIINRVSLLKSGSTTTLANFTIWFFSAAPVVTSPAQYDAVAYTGPRAADMPNYIGNAQCNTPTATSDTSAQVWYDCTLGNPNTGGALDFQALSASTNINYLISVTAAYTPASAETFIPYVSGFY